MPRKGKSTRNRDPDFDCKVQVRESRLVRMRYKQALKNLKERHGIKLTLSDLYRLGAQKYFANLCASIRLKQIEAGEPDEGI